MVYINGGTFTMGSDDQLGYPYDGEGPTRQVEISPFYIDRWAVTNQQFNDFVRSTGYVTEAERYGWSFVFKNFISEETLSHNNVSPPATPWWLVVKGADWTNPEGPDSSIETRGNHPVVHISWNDAVEYCNWSKKRLPTEAEWEYAATGGLNQIKYPWGDDLMIDNKYMCNVWQGTFPSNNTQLDGFIGTAPVNTFSPNNFGLYNMAGNVWEWCSDWFTTNHSSDTLTKFPQDPSPGTYKTIKGGSYLCHDSYCNRYRIAARSSNTPDSSTGNLGFRCVTDVK
tara:strand:- start:5824 stop:6672 length:849 start_codon:yes stop_codon:yes gene_type:complete